MMASPALNPRHSAPEEALGHRVHANGWLIQKYEHELPQQGNASAQLLLAATARSREEEGLGQWQLSTSSSPTLPPFPPCEHFTTPAGAFSNTAHTLPQEAL